MRAHLYPAVGVLLAMGAPLGLFLLRNLTGDDGPWLTYTYVSLSTSIKFAVLGWRLGRKEDQLYDASLTDALTGVSNRRHFDARLREETARAARHRQPLALLLVDVDRLKDINDRDGHAAGDAALVAVAAALVGSCRATDVAARYGGDEFAVLAPMTLRGEAIELAQRIRAHLRAHATVTVSIGVADSESSVPLCQAADRALYAAKAAGRDRVLAGPLVSALVDE
jgi:diguanylate cyclase (GGDEF)-like protein